MDSRELVSRLQKTYSQHGQTSKMELFAKMVEGKKLHLKCLIRFWIKLHLRCFSGFWMRVWKKRFEESIGQLCDFTYQNQKKSRLTHNTMKSAYNRVLIQKSPKTTISLLPLGNCCKLKTKITRKLNDIKNTQYYVVKR